MFWVGRLSWKVVLLQTEVTHPHTQNGEMEFHTYIARVRESYVYTPEYVCTVASKASEPGVEPGFLAFESLSRLHQSGQCLTTWLHRHKTAA